MSRSKKKSPFIGGASSEKECKRLYNRRYRRIIKQIVQSHPHMDILPHLRDYSNPWAMAKDGKWMFDPEKHPTFLRK